MTYYNEIDAYPAQWMRNLIDAGHIAPGVVDNRSIADVTPEDIGDGQAHFFAGIGVWSLALRWAGVPDGAPVWTGSCPCQPFSTAGKRRGSDDERHLWPVWFRLIEQRRPPIVFGEQVASAAGRDWLSAVRADMETLGYAVGGADLCAAGAGSDNIRQRLFWVAYARCERFDRLRLLLRSEDGHRGTCAVSEAPGRCEDGAGVGNPHRDDSGGHAGTAPRTQAASSRAGQVGRAFCHVAESPSDDGVRLGYAHDARSQGHGRSVAVDDAHGREAAKRHGAASGVQLPPIDRWWVECDDPVRGRIVRPAEPSTFPLAARTPGHVGRLRAYGNAINARVAAVFIRSALDAIEDL